MLRRKVGAVIHASFTIGHTETTETRVPLNNLGSSTMFEGGDQREEPLVERHFLMRDRVLPQIDDFVQCAATPPRFLPRPFGVHGVNAETEQEANNYRQYVPPRLGRAV